MKILKYLLLLILLLVVIFIAKGFLTPEISYASEITVDKSAEEAWAVMSDQSKLPEWIKGFQKSELVSGTANTAGAVSNIYVVENGTEMIMEETINKIIANELLDMTFRMDFMDMDYKMILSEKEGKTLIQSSSTTKGNGILARSIVSFMPKAMKAQEDKNMNNLKNLIDKNTTNYFPETIMKTLEESTN